MSDPQPPAALWGDERYGGACVVLADDVPLGTADGSGLPDRGLPSSSMPERLTAAALAVTHEQLRRGRWVSRIRLTDDRSARETVAQLRADGHAAVLGPPDETHAVGWRNRNRAVQVGGKLAVCFPWADADAAAVVEVDAGDAFGAGTHPSTRLLAEWLAEHISGGERVLDVGCGSGVLALVAARLGAAEVVGIDIEPAAIAVAEANAQRNGLDAVASFGVVPVCGAELGRYDVVVANITAGVLMPLAGDIAERVAAGGWLAISGISAAQTSAVAAAYLRHGIELADPVRLDDWVSLSGRTA